MNSIMRKLKRDGVISKASRSPYDYYKLCGKMPSVVNVVPSLEEMLNRLERIESLMRLIKSPSNVVYFCVESEVEDRK